ncbi:acyl-CoA thioesterase [Actinosynnema sp. NPDC059335]|uniref:acyl-CoA thioesterase n=1 Tax=Actinosynnema sp. NPDC059335 TaxID=3346804 RepID=UPI003672BD47
MNAVREFHWRHVVTFDETNLVGNVYFAQFLHWQGHCREMFLARHAPGVLKELSSGGLVLATRSCSMEFFGECFAFDEIVIAMTLRERWDSALRMGFDFRRDDRLVARGEQTVAALRRVGSGVEPVAVPEELVAALAPYEVTRRAT